MFQSRDMVWTADMSISYGNGKNFDIFVDNIMNIIIILFIHFKIVGKAV